MAKAKRRIRVSREKPSAESVGAGSESRHRPRKRPLQGAREPSHPTLALPGQFPPVDRAYLRPVVGHKARPPRTGNSPPLPAFYGGANGNYLLELTAFSVGTDGA